MVSLLLGISACIGNKQMSIVQGYSLWLISHLGGGYHLVVGDVNLSHEALGEFFRALCGATFVSVAGYIYIVAVCAELTVVRHILCGSNGSAVRLYKLYYVRPVKCYGYQVVVYLYYVIRGVAEFITVFVTKPLVAHYCAILKICHASIVRLPHSLVQQYYLLLR